MFLNKQQDNQNARNIRSKKQQVGFRMPTYLLNEVDGVVSKYEINRSEFLNEAAKDYLQAIKEQEVYSRLDEAMQEVKLMIDGKIPSRPARDLLDEI